MSFLKLPGEIRNRIYRCLVINDGPIHIVELDWTKDGTGYQPALTPQPALARTSKTIRQEALSLYCGENAFEFGVTSGGHQLSMTEVSEALERWIVSLGDSAKHLRQVKISANCEIMGPRNAAYWLRDFWEIIEFSIAMDAKSGLEYHLSGDPSFDDLCTCELDQWVGTSSPRLADIVLKASSLWFQTTDLGECEACNRPCLREPVKKDLTSNMPVDCKDGTEQRRVFDTLQGWLGGRRSRSSPYNLYQDSQLIRIPTKLLKMFSLMWSMLPLTFCEDNFLSTSRVFRLFAGVGLSV